MANEGFKAEEPKTSCIMILCEPKNLLKVKGELKLLRVEFTDDNRYLQKFCCLLGFMDGTMNTTAKKPGTQWDYKHRSIS